MALESLILPRSLAPPEFKERSLDLHNGFLLVTNSFERCLLTTREVALHSCDLSARLSRPLPGGCPAMDRMRLGCSGTIISGTLSTVSWALSVSCLSLLTTVRRGTECCYDASGFYLPPGNTRSFLCANHDTSVSWHVGQRVWCSCMTSTAVCLLLRPCVGPLLRIPLSPTHQSCTTCPKAPTDTSVMESPFRSP